MRENGKAELTLASMTARALLICGGCVFALMLLSGCGGDEPLSQPVPIGPEMQVNTGTAGPLDGYARVSSDPEGNFVVGWNALIEPADGSMSMANRRRFDLAQRYDREGVPLGGNFQLSSGPEPQYTFGGWLSHDADGNFVFVWADGRGRDGDGNGVLGRRFDDQGRPLGPDFVVNATTAGSQFGGPVTSDAEGNFVAVWTFDGNVIGQRFDRQGARAGQEFQVNTTTGEDPRGPTVASDRDGNFIVAWSDFRLPAQFRLDVFARRFDRSGVPQGAEFMVNTYTTGFQGQSLSVAADAEGDWVAVWNSFSGQDGDSDGIFGQRIDRGGARVGQEFQVNTYTMGQQFPATVASDREGNFLVTWLSFAPDHNGIRAQLFDAEGQQVGGEFQVNSQTSAYEYPAAPAVSAGEPGTFVVAWHSFGYDADQNGVNRILAQRFSAVGDDD